MVSSGGFWGYLRGKRGVLIALSVVIGVLLLTFGSLTGSGERKKDEKMDIAEMCSLIEGVGECYALVSYTDGGEPESVAVICEGGDSITVRYRLTEMLSSYLGIGANRISIESLKKR